MYVLTYIISEYIQTAKMKQRLSKTAPKTIFEDDVNPSQL